MAKPTHPAQLLSPVTAAEVAATRQPTIQARTLPPRVYHDPAVLAYEQVAWFDATWLCVGRAEDVALPGDYVLTEISGEELAVIRGNDGQLRAFHNVCRHRGATLLAEPCGRLARIQCPYHAWVYDLEGHLHQPRHTDRLVGFDAADYGLISVPLAIWQGFVFLNLDGSAPPLGEWLGDLPDYVARYDLMGLRRARRIDYDVRANWKGIIENYAECYHCPGVHPQLNKITPYDLGGWLPSSDDWTGSWMEVTGDFETLSTDGSFHGRPLVPGTTPDDLKRVYYFEVWPNLLLSLHPDYLMVHRVWPQATDRTLITCEWFFAADAVNSPAFDPADVISFWDLTNRQDWHVCELQHRGTQSRAYRPGRYAMIETGVHAFDLMVADRYADDGRRTRPTHSLKAVGRRTGRV